MQSKMLTSVSYIPYSSPRDNGPEVTQAAAGTPLWGCSPRGTHAKTGTLLSDRGPQVTHTWGKALRKNVARKPEGAESSRGKAARRKVQPNKINRQREQQIKQICTQPQNSCVTHHLPGVTRTG